MIARVWLVLSLFFLPVCLVLAEAPSCRLSELVSQLDGRSCACQLDGNTLKRRNVFASLLRRHDKYWCVVDAARQLALMGPAARASVPDLIAALQKYRNIDTGDGVIALRSHVALALGAIGDPSAVKPLIVVLLSEDRTRILDSASVPAISSPEGSSYAAVVSALEMFGPLAREALPVLVELLDREGGPFDELLRKQMEAALAAINR